MNDSTRRLKPLHIGAIVLGVVIVIAAVAIAAFYIGSSRQADQAVVQPSTAGGRGTVATSENVKDLQAEASKPVEDGYYESKMNTDWDFPSGTQPSTNAYVENSVNNKRTVYFDLTLADTKELVYSSPYIPVGAKLDKFKLDKALPAGKYAGVVTYHLVDDNHQELTTVSVSVNLTIDK
jgi:type II secretory pathway pseudopilin PulG